ncbi:MAG: type 2 isopentenyl-diphosphate Delta-isomerase [Candidatus Lokiarchaeota archaeon]|nr:type 2 isopentenyl-diphosphate Delta-isomerase [Candidatus Lokiarchaeota archaeon]
MNETEKIILLKLGGSLLTEKNKPFSLRKDVIKNAVNQIGRSNKKLIIIHGGGSFGHPLAKKYSISKGINNSIENQIMGLSETHDAMNKLNSYVISEFLDQLIPAISIQTSSIFLKKSHEYLIKTVDIIETYLKLGLIPILYGDIVVEKSGNFSILSGDQIILELCNNLNKFKVEKVIFTTETDGIYINENDSTDNTKLATEIHYKDLDNINLANLGQKIDVTGGMKGKIDSIKKICDLNIPVQIINGLKPNYILKALKSEKIKGTYIGIDNNDRITRISRRKIEHLKIPIDYNVQNKSNYFDDIELIYHAFPQINFDDVNLSTNFFGKIISAPICIAAITGGHPVAYEINKILADAAENQNIIMSVGSQRAGLVDPELSKSFSIVREIAPDIPIIGNLGIGQLSRSNFNLDDFIDCINMIKADVMAVHFNALHELFQEKGDKTYNNLLENFKEVKNAIKIPIIAKEVGSGFNQEVAQTLENIGFDGFDVGGAGGTSFAAIESHRNNNLNSMYTRNPAELFRDWGIPTPVSISYVRKVSQKPIISTGGLRNGIDIAKSIALGANIGGFAYKFLLTAWKDYKNNSKSNSIKEIITLKNELQSCLWLMNASNSKEIFKKKDKLIILGNLYNWFNQNKTL